MIQPPTGAGVDGPHFGIRSYTGLDAALLWLFPYKLKLRRLACLVSRAAARSFMLPDGRSYRLLEVPPHARANALHIPLVTFLLDLLTPVKLMPLSEWAQQENIPVQKIVTPKSGDTTK